jgi:hypothetical protein
MVKRLKNILPCKVEIEEFLSESENTIGYMIYYWNENTSDWSLEHPEHCLIPKKYRNYGQSFGTLHEAIRQVKLFNCFDITVLYLDGREEKY